MNHPQNLNEKNSSKSVKNRHFQSFKHAILKNKSHSKKTVDQSNSIIKSLSSENIKSSSITFPFVDNNLRIPLEIEQPNAFQTTPIKILSDSPTDSKNDFLINNEVSNLYNWNRENVDIEKSKIAIQYLNNLRQKRLQELSEIDMAKENQVEDFLKQMEDRNHETNSNSDVEKIRSHFESNHKQTNRRERELKKLVDSVDFCLKRIISGGIPYDVEIKQHIKSLLGKQSSGSTKLNSSALNSAPSKKEKSKILEDFESFSKSRKFLAVRSAQSASFKSNPYGVTKLSSSAENIKFYPHDEDILNSNRLPHIRTQEFHGSAISKTSSSNEASLMYNATMPILNISLREDLIQNSEKQANLIPSSSSSSMAHKPSLLPGNLHSAQFLITNNQFSDQTSQSDFSAARQLSGSRLRNTFDDTPQALVSLNEDGTLKNLLEQILALRQELTCSRDITESLDSRLRELQLNTESNVAIGTNFAHTAIARVEKVEQNVDNFKQQTISEFKQNIQSLEGKFEYWLSSSTRSLRDNIENIENQLKQLEARADNLNAQPGRLGGHFGYGSGGSNSLIWPISYSDSNSLNNHLITSLLHILTIVAILLSAAIHCFLKLINSVSHVMQHRNGLLLMIFFSLCFSYAYFNYPSVSQITKTTVDQIWFFLFSLWQKFRNRNDK